MHLRNTLLIIGQYLIPKHLVSRIVGIATNSRISWVKNTIIQWFIKTYGVNLSEAEESDPLQFASFNAFFTRKLKLSVRPIPQDPMLFTSPADGVISQVGEITQGQILQAKGHLYSITDLLAGEGGIAEQFFGGSAITIYLSPKDYHRLHMPVDGVLETMWFVPGDLFSVNTLTTQSVPRLFARNERVVALFRTPIGQVAIVLVGALICASIRTTWAGTVAPGGNRIQKTTYAKNEHVFTRGDEMGSFALGSTVIVLTQKNAVQLADHCLINAAVKVHDALGVCTHNLLIND